MKLETKTKLLERAISARRELFAFGVLVSLWGVILGAFGGALYAILRRLLVDWAWAHPVIASLIGTLLFLLLTGCGAYLLANWLSEGGKESRSFKLLLPVMAFSDRLEALEIEGYGVLKGTRQRFAREAPKNLIAAYLNYAKDLPGDPFIAEVHSVVASAASGEMTHQVSDACERLLSKHAVRHGFDFHTTLKPSKVPIEGAPDRKILLPAGCHAVIAPSASDKRGNRTSELHIRGPFGNMGFCLLPQWAYLSEQFDHATLEEMERGLGEGLGHYSICDWKRPPTLWPIVINVRLRAEVTSNLVFRLSKKSDDFARWIDELLDLVEESISWDAFIGS